MTEKKLPTKEELRAEMQKTCDSVNKWRGLKAKVVDCNGSMQIQMTSDTGYTFGIWPEKYKKPIVAPKKWTPVFVFWPGRNGSRIILERAFSSGNLGNGRLIVYYGDATADTEHWCEIYNRDNHSENWDKEWEKMEND